MARKISRPAGRNRTASAQKSASVPASRRQEEVIENFFLGVLLFFLAVLVFYPVFSAGFIWDDDQLLTANQQVHSSDGWWSLWFKPQTADYFPLTSATLWLEYHLGQYFALWNVDFLQHYPNDTVWTGWHGNPVAWSGYHITNVLFHALAVVLTWQTLKRLRIPGAWFAAAIFAVHPVCVESVAWISERKNTISQIFFLLAIIKYVRFEEKGRLRSYIWAVVWFLVSLLAKTSVVMLPFLLLLLAWWRHRDLEPLRESYELETNPTERGILLWSCIAGGVMLGGAAVLLNAPMGLGAADRLALGWKTLKFWLALISLLVGLLAGGGLGYAVWAQLRRLKQWNSFAGFEVIRMFPFFLVAFLLGVVTIYFQYGRAIAGEEIPLGNLWQRAASACFATGFYLYSALWPFNINEIYPQWHRAFTLVVTQPRIHVDPPAPESIPYYIQVLPGLVIGGLLAFCWMRRTEKWARALLVGLGCYIIAMLPALGLLKMSYMRLTLVADHFQYISIVAVIALIVSAGFTRGLKPLWLGVAALAFLLISYLNWGQTADNHAAQALWIGGSLALAVATLLPDLWKYVWGGFLVAVLLCFSIISWNQTEIYHGEKTLWSATLEKNPNTWQGHNHLGAALYMEGDWRNAGPHFYKATVLKPENPESHNNLGLYYSMLKDMPHAIEQFRIAVGIKDDSAMETNLANAYEQTGQFDLAIDTYKKAINLATSLGTQNASAHCNLGYALMQEGKIDEAIPEFMETMKEDPGMPQGRTDLMQALRAKGIDPEAPDQPELRGKLNFDLDEALRLLKSGPPQQPQPAQQ
jgi:tetratricopeptide (TPR) repeat protein